jgi:hypothetical protein
MIIKKNIRILAIVYIILLILFVNTAVNAKETTTTKIDLTVNDDSYMIEGFPYVGQSTEFYCMFTTTTMVFNYYGLNISLLEALYNSGVGYSTLYSLAGLDRCLIGGNGASNWEADRTFLASLYGLSYSVAHENSWETFWNKTKQNITQDKAVITTVNPRSLTSIRNAVKQKLNISDNIWEKIPDFAWNLFPSIPNHNILIVGFNESNNTICYNDPSPALLGYPECGHYAWMDLQDFKEALKKYNIGVFENITKNPLDKEMIFEKVHERNIELMKGNSSTYDERLINKSKIKFFGIEAVKQLKKDLGKGINHRIATIFAYKKLCARSLFPLSYKIYRFFDIFLPSFLNMTDYHTMANYFCRIAIEKNDMSDYLWEKQYEFSDENLSDICKHDSKILEYEAENYTKLADEFTMFLKRGMFISLPRAILVTNKMAMITDKIIKLEEEIINQEM